MTQHAEQQYRADQSPNDEHAVDLRSDDVGVEGRRNYSAFRLGFGLEAQRERSRSMGRGSWVTGRSYSGYGGVGG